MQQGVEKEILTNIFAIKFEDLPNPATYGLPELPMTVNLALNFISSVIAIWVPQTPGSINLFKEMGFEPADNKLNRIGKIAHCIQESLIWNDFLYILPLMAFFGKYNATSY